MSNTISIYTRKLGRFVAKQAKGTAGKYHVIHSMPHKWRVVAEGRDRALRVFDNKSDAVSFAKKHAKTSINGEVVVHEVDGKIAERFSY